MPPAETTGTRWHPHHPVWRTETASGLISSHHCRPHRPPPNTTELPGTLLSDPAACGGNTTEGRGLLRGARHSQAGPLGSQERVPPLQVRVPRVEGPLGAQHGARHIPGHGEQEGFRGPRSCGSSGDTKCHVQSGERDTHSRGTALRQRRFSISHKAAQRGCGGWELLFNSEFPKTCNPTWQVVGWEECLSPGRCDRRGYCVMS